MVLIESSNRGGSVRSSFCWSFARLCVLVERSRLRNWMCAYYSDVLNFSYGSEGATGPEEQSKSGLLQKL